MHGLPPDTDLSFFSGKTLVQVCIGVNEIILNFEPILRVTVLSSICCAPPATTLQTFSDAREAAKVLVCFLDDKIATASAGPDGAVTILFQSGGRIQLVEDRTDYESYIIDNGAASIVV
jgi:hypothetical protein